mmetsp:Transcript_49347/g.81949  ORF Transcript_49347/g.81949 Transcript_49347/m.81949 type:complete len:189 (+) Transcript_49347:336-902(+)
MRTFIYFSRMLHGRGVCRLAPPRTIAAAITGVGDLVSQLVIESHEYIDQLRFLTCTGLGALLEGAVLQRWYALLHSRLPGKSSVIFVKRLLLHQTAFAPLLVPTFMTATTLIPAVAAAATSTKRPPETWWKGQQEWWPAVCAHWLIVAPTQVINAYLVPKHFQVLLANSCALVWATALSRLSHRPLTA